MPANSCPYIEKPCGAFERLDEKEKEYLLNTKCSNNIHLTCNVFHTYKSLMEPDSSNK